MKPKTLIPLVIGLAVGFFAIKMGVDMVRKAKGSQENRQAILISAKPIEVATDIQESMLSSKAVAESLLPPDAFVKREELVGRVTKIPIPAGVAITRAMLAPPGAQPGLGAKIPAGHRAVSISVTEESAVAGFVAPGSRVDVSVVCGRGDEATSKMILTDVEVGAVGQSMSRKGKDGKQRLAKSVTLFLTPEKVQVLNAATSAGKGKLRLALRGHGKDPSESLFSKLLKLGSHMAPAAPAAPVTVEAEAEPEPAPQPAIHVVDVRRGDMSERLVFDQFGNVQRLAVSGPVGAPRQPEMPLDAARMAAPQTVEEDDEDPPDMEVIE